MGTGPGGSVFAENSFYRKIEVQDEGRRHVVKRSTDTWVAHPEVKVKVRDLVRVVGIVASFAPRGFSVRFIEPQMVDGHRRHVPGAPSSGTPRESQAKFSDGSMWVL